MVIRKIERSVNARGKGNWHSCKEKSEDNYEFSSRRGGGNGRSQGKRKVFIKKKNTML